MYKTVVIDPPWKKSTGGVGHSSLQMSTHYAVQTKEEIVSTVREWFRKFGVAPECHAYMWSVNSFTAGQNQGIIPALEVFESLGFTPITLIPWVKSNVGSPTPYGMRYTEMCIFGVRYEKGKGKRVMYRGNSDIESVPKGKGFTSSKDFIIAERRQHSRKPDAFYQYVEERSRGPYLDLYSRTDRPGWKGVGLEAGTWKV